MAKVYEVFSEGNSDSYFYLNRKLVDSIYFGRENEGDWTVTTHNDICELLEKQHRENHEQYMAILRAADLLAERLPVQRFGGPDLENYDEWATEVHRWIIKNAPSVAETYGLKPL